MDQGQSSTMVNRNRSHIIYKARIHPGFDTNKKYIIGIGLCQGYLR